MEWTEVTFLWIKPQMGGKDLEAKNILIILKAIAWKGKKRYRVTRGACRIGGRVVVPLLLGKSGES